MAKLRILVDLVMPADALALLKEGTGGQELVTPQRPAASVMGKGERDPSFETADVAFGQPDPHAILESKRLRWVHISSSGITRYDTAEFRAALAQRQIALSNSASVYNEPCAVHVLSFMLAQARKLPLGLKTRAAGGTAEWHAVRGACRVLRGETVVIVGCGAIANRLVELLRPFSMNVLAYRRKPLGNEPVPILTGAELGPALARADHVVDLLPASGSTRHFFDAPRFASCKRGAIFYNIGRGATVDHEALLQALRAGRVAAAWLDVTEPEPLPDNHPLRSEPNCYITPHVAGGHAEEARNLVRHFLANLDRFVRGEPLLDRVM